MTNEIRKGKRVKVIDSGKIGIVTNVGYIIDEQYAKLRLEDGSETSVAFSNLELIEEGLNGYDNTIFFKSGQTYSFESQSSLLEDMKSIADWDEHKVILSRKLIPLKNVDYVESTPIDEETKS